MIDVVEIDALNGDVTQRPYTDKEAQKRAADLAASEAAAAEAAAKAEADAAATAAAIAHAKSLGFTDAMIAVMYPNLNTVAV